MSGVPVFRQISPWVALPEYIYSANDPKITDEPGVWFPLAEAESLIDPNDPAVREDAVVAAAVQMVANRTPGEVVDAVLAALRGAK